MTVDKVSVTKKVNSVAIIGAGASGAVAVDVLKKEEAFEKIKVFERKNSFGGVWHLDETPDFIKVASGSNETENDPQLEIPENLKDNGEKLSVSRSNKARFINTPAYENIKTNVPEHFMTFSDNPNWPDDKKPVDEPFTTRRYVAQYIHDYIQPNIEHVTLRTTLERIDKDYSNLQNPFILTLRQETDVKDAEGKFVDLWWKESFDAVILATGHYHVPHIPFVEGLNDVLEKFPERIEYAKQFRDPERYTGKRTLVVGASASALDIAFLLSKFSNEVYRSERDHEENSAVRKINIDLKTTIKPIITKYEITENGFNVVFSDGTILENPDFVIYGTGYDYSYPFLRHLWPNFSEKGVRLPENFQHTFHIPDPLISTLGVPVGALSFRAFEYQSILVSRFLSGKIDLPSKEQQYQWVKDREKNIGINRRFHAIGSENVVKYLQDLTDLGGGVEAIGEHGRKFPVVTQEQVLQWRDKKEAIVAKWQNQADVGLSWG
ncbi:hypothetical protein BN7_936 [Wickerhamomyces ciferrii]|uniref:Flavin-containing monooxygenase n=1 Tax=Wickerhamomyces ciferrii (strain ATCC 14091 / BCRC 22168 / CBS 111 / JCM 3599 / NBRC 0793 / NRRL Y-1031 F-60-10) TaxID=1206466 RepID=K0K935_WICCF|nr:uncharacterized protein BN7_936 [Wickerhamomyces ciferrii]CCH41395.1 hypothetical protein BN7_936 [Wickerhamomyces ciferrii]